MVDFRIAGGRVIDLTSPPDGVKRDIVLHNGTVAERANGREQVLDATGSLILPGFIDVHLHLAPSWGGRFGPEMAACAGTAFALDATGPSAEVRELLLESHVPLRVGVCEAVHMEDLGRSIGEARAAVKSALGRGAIGIKILGGHFPLTPAANKHVIAACNEAGCLCVAHVGSTQTYSDVEGLAEMLQLADGMPLHVSHVNGYCRGYHGLPIEEAATSLALLREHPNATSDSYVFRWNALPLECDDDGLRSHATRFWLDRLGYSPDLGGVLAAWSDGCARLVVPSGCENVLMSYADAGENPERWLGEAFLVSLPVNPVEAAVALAGARDASGERFVIDCLATDGGGIPRNVMVSVAYQLVKLGVWSWTDVIHKTSTGPARIIGLPPRGLIEPGQPADLTLLDEATGTVVGTLVAGMPAYWRGLLHRASTSEIEQLYHPQRHS